MKTTKNAFVDAAKTESNVTTTTNGMKAYVSTMNSNLDFFAKSGSVSHPNLISNFLAALKEDEDLAIRNLLHMRDVRTGKGIRNNSRTILTYLAQNKPELITSTNIVQRFVDLGRWDDILEILKQPNKQPSNFVLNLIAAELQKEQPNKLLCKWLPRNDKVAAKDRKSNYDIVAKLLRQKLQLSPKQYRQLLVKNTEVVETQMCSKKWNNINFQFVPSQAFRIYKKAFERHTPDLFTKFINKVESGEATVNASSIWPHEILRSVIPSPGQHRKNTYSPATQAQWNSLPDFMQSEKSILPLIDVSGSMSAKAYSDFTCATLAVSLGLYTAERNKSAFKNMFMTFESQPSLCVLRDTMSLTDKVNHIANQPWGGSTDIVAALQKVVTHALKHKVPKKDMPEYLVVFTDMGFNSYNSYDSYGNKDAMEVVRTTFKSAGYKVPVVVWWNLSGTANPVVLDQTKKTAIMSGFSPSNFKAIFELDSENFNPMSIMTKVLLDDKYGWK